MKVAEGQKTPIRGRRLLMTGASRGIGRAVAWRLLAEGAELVLLARSPTTLGPWPEGSRVHALQADLTQLDEHAAWVEVAAGHLGGLDGLINCAGIVHYQPILEVPRADLQAQLQVNFLAPFMLCQAAARHMQDHGRGGDLIQIASTLAERPAPLTAAYGASKAALIAFTRSCALEWAPLGIRANAIAPGVVDTDMVNVLRPGARSGPAGLLSPEQALEQQRQQLAALHPLGRLGRPEDVAQAVCYLLQSPFVTGTVLSVDGGLGLA